MPSEPALLPVAAVSHQANTLSTSARFQELQEFQELGWLKMVVGEKSLPRNFSRYRPYSESQLGNRRD
jgi:hypothetical protein